VLLSCAHQRSSVFICGSSFRYNRISMGSVVVGTLSDFPKVAVAIETGADGSCWCAGRARSRLKTAARIAVFRCTMAE
jgi:hypothetical protein